MSYETHGIGSIFSEVDAQFILTDSQPLFDIETQFFTESQHLDVFGQNSSHYFFDATLFGDGQASLQQGMIKSPFTSLAFKQISTTLR